MPYDPLGTPTREQITKLQEKVKGTRYVVKIDDGSEFDSAAHLLIWDDEHEILHVCTQNEDFNTQAVYPIKMRCVEYAQIRNINGYFT